MKVAAAHEDPASDLAVHVEMNHRQLGVRRQLIRRELLAIGGARDEQRALRAKVQRVGAETVVLPVQPCGRFAAEVTAARVAMPRGVAREDEMREDGLAADTAR